MLHAPIERRQYARRNVLGVSVTDFSRDEAQQFILGRIALKNFMPITFLNAHNANIAVRDDGFRRSLERFTVLSDGLGIDIASKVLHGSYFRANLNGTDLVPQLVRSSQTPLKVGLVGARPDVVHRAARRFQELDARHEFRVIHHGYFDAAEERRILDDLAAWKPDILLVAMGVPKQERWIAERITGEHCTVAMGVGALFDFVSGEVTRAPRWVRAVRSEWAFRLLQEPRRLAGRYLIGNPVFIGHVLRWRFSVARRSKMPVTGPGI